MVLEAHFELVEFAEVSREKKIFWGMGTLALEPRGPWKMDLEFNEMSLAHSFTQEGKRVS